MVTSMGPICSTLGIDRVDMLGKIVLIEEQHGCDANFLTNAFIYNALEKNYGICFVLFHNTFSHYHNVGMKSGYNLMTLQEKGKVTLVEPIKELMQNIDEICMDTDIEDIGNRVLTDLKNSNKTVIDNMVKLLQTSYNELASKSTNVLIIIEDISHLCDLGLSLRDSMHYLTCIRSFLKSYPTVQLCVTVHTYKNDVQSSIPDFISNNCKYMADLILIAEPLATGHSSDASGKVTVNWNIDSVRNEFHWAEKMIYLYKLLDWHIKMFAPGATTVSST